MPAPLANTTRLEETKVNMATRTPLTELQARIARRLGAPVHGLVNMHGRWFADVGNGWQLVSDLLKAPRDIQPEPDLT